MTLFQLCFLAFGFLHIIHSVKSLRILCLILTTPTNLGTRARAINVTWGPRCDRFFFITELPRYQMTFAELSIAKTLPIAPIDHMIDQGYDHLTKKVTSSFLFAYEHHRNDFDWFIKTDDDTYLLVDHLRHFLMNKTSSEPVTYGYNFKILVSQGYHSGGAGYVLSREALRRFYAAHQPPFPLCSNDGGSEDVEIARCLRKQGVFPGVALDPHRRDLFHPLPFSHHFRGLFPGWLFLIAENPVRKGFDGCAERSISFHYVSPEEMYLMDFLYLSTKEEND